MELRIFIGPESVHSVPLSQTGSLTHCCLLDLIDTLAVESVNPRLVDVVVDFDVCIEESISDTVVTTNMASA